MRRLFLHFMCFEFPKSHAYNINCCIQQAKDLWQNCPTYCLLLSWRCHGQELRKHQHFNIWCMQDTSICSSSCLPLFLDIAFPRQCYLPCFIPLLPITAFSYHFGALPAVRHCNWPAWYVRFGLISARWELGIAQDKGINSQMVQILFGPFWYEKNLARLGKEYGSGPFIPMEIPQLGQLFAFLGGKQHSNLTQNYVLLAITEFHSQCDWLLSTHISPFHRWQPPFNFRQVKSPFIGLRSRPGWGVSHWISPAGCVFARKAICGKRVATWLMRETHVWARPESVRKLPLAMLHGVSV